MANVHINKNVQKEKNEKTMKQVLKKGFEAGVTMACLSMGKFESDEETPLLQQFIEKLYSEFEDIYFHTKERKQNE